MRNSNFRGCHCNRFPLYRESRNSYRENHETCQLINCTLLHRVYKILSGGERTISILASCRRRLLPLSFTSPQSSSRSEPLGSQFSAETNLFKFLESSSHLWTDSIFTQLQIGKNGIMQMPPICSKERFRSNGSDLRPQSKILFSPSNFVVYNDDRSTSFPIGDGSFRH